MQIFTPVTGIGKLIANYLYANDIKQASLARKINVLPQNLNRAIKNDLLNLDQLIVISKSLGHNFFYDIAALIDKEMGVSTKEKTEIDKLVPVGQIESIVARLMDKKNITATQASKKPAKKKAKKQR